MNESKPETCLTCRFCDISMERITEARATWESAVTQLRDLEAGSDTTAPCERLGEARELCASTHDHLLRAETGLCRRRSPQILLRFPDPIVEYPEILDGSADTERYDGSQGMDRSEWRGHWPAVHATDWCGKHEPKERKADLLTPINDLDLSVRSHNALVSDGITTLGDLVKRTARDLTRLRNFGKASLAEVRRLLRDHGLRLVGEGAT